MPILHLKQRGSNRILVADPSKHPERHRRSFAESEVRPLADIWASCVQDEDEVRVKQTYSSESGEGTDGQTVQGTDDVGAAAKSVTRCGTNETEEGSEAMHVGTPESPRKPEPAKAKRRHRSHAVGGEPSAADTTTSATVHATDGNAGRRYDAGSLPQLFQQLYTHPTAADATSFALPSHDNDGRVAESSSTAMPQSSVGGERTATPASEQPALAPLPGLATVRRIFMSPRDIDDIWAKGDFAFACNEPADVRVEKWWAQRPGLVHDYKRKHRRAVQRLSRMGRAPGRFE